MAQNGTTFEWNAKQTEAAQLIADGQLADEEIAQKLGIGRRTLARWKLHQEFQSRIKDITSQTAEALKTKSIRDKDRRLTKLERIIKRLDFVMRERGKDHSDAPGGKSGLLVRQIKGIGSGDNFQEITEYAVDTGLLKEYREYCKAIAIELGEWAERREHSGPGGAPLNPPSLKILIDGKDAPTTQEAGRSVPEPSE